MLTSCICSAGILVNSGNCWAKSSPTSNMAVMNVGCGFWFRKVL
jgi:hypothetical protein